jgi:hypothetical protein
MLSERLIPDMPFDVAWALDALGQRMGDDVLATAIAPLLKNEEVDQIYGKSCLCFPVTFFSMGSFFSH